MRENKIDFRQIFNVVVLLKLIGVINEIDKIGRHLKKKRLLLMKRS